MIHIILGSWSGVLCITTIVACVWLGAGQAQEFPTFDPGTYDALNNADSGASIAPGTKITTQTADGFRLLRHQSEILEIAHGR